MPLSAIRWWTPNRCCSSMTASERSANATPPARGRASPRRGRRLRRDPLEDPGSVLPRHRGGEQGVRHAGRRPRRDRIQRGLRASSARADASSRYDRPRTTEERLDLTEVLSREHLGGSHDRRLVARSDRDEGRVQRDERLAGADVALEQDVHRSRARHRPVDLLVARRCAAVGSNGSVRTGARAADLRLVRHADLGALDPMLSERKPSSSTNSSSNFSRSIAAASSVATGSGCPGSRGRTAATPPRGSGPRASGRGSDRVVRARAIHELADRPRRDALGRSVDRRDPPRVHQVLIVALEQLDLLVRELEPASVQLRDARDRDLVPSLYIEPVQGWLKNVRSR